MPRHEGIRSVEDPYVSSADSEWYIRENAVALVRELRAKVIALRKELHRANHRAGIYKQQTQNLGKQLHLTLETWKRCFDIPPPDRACKLAEPFQ